MNKNICVNYREDPSPHFSLRTDSQVLAWEISTAKTFVGVSFFNLVEGDPPKSLADALKERLPLFEAFAASEPNSKERNKLYWQCVNNDHMYPELPSEDGFLLCPQETLKAPKGEQKEVTYAVSYTYNGGTAYRSKWYKGYRCQPPTLPKGFELVGLGVGYEFNCHPPRATALLRKVKP